MKVKKKKQKKKNQLTCVQRNWNSISFLLETESYYQHGRQASEQENSFGYQGMGADISRTDLSGETLGQMDPEDGWKPSARLCGPGVEAIPAEGIWQVCESV